MGMQNITVSRSEGWKLIASNTLFTMQLKSGPPDNTHFQYSGPLHIHLGSSPPPDVDPPYFELTQGDMFINQQSNVNVYVRVGALYIDYPIHLTLEGDAITGGNSGSGGNSF